jgi:transcription antitermination protein NusB
MSKPSFLDRKRSRRIAMQALYGWLLTKNSPSVIEKHILEEHEKDSFDREYFHTVLFDVIEQVDELEVLMTPYLSRALNELGYVEHAVLLISTYELQSRPEIPYKVVINEALELSKSFGAQESHKFVNGVLDKMAKDLRKGEFNT